MIYGSGLAISFSLTERYFRAVAKISFHYFLSQFPHYSGHEPKFDDIRQYIVTGDRDVLTRSGELVASLVILPVAFVLVVGMGR